MEAVEVRLEESTGERPGKNPTSEALIPPYRGLTRKGFRYKGSHWNRLWGKLHCNV